MGRWSFLACFVVACGSEPQDVDSGADATASDAASETTGFDVVVEHAPSVVLADGGPFLCRGCICNGADHECFELEHVMPLSPVDGGFDDAATCAPDAGFVGCVPIPAECMPAPSCDCALAHAPFGPWYCTCQLDPSDSGIVVHCIEP